jgi:hypothetical protein
MKIFTNQANQKKLCFQYETAAECDKLPDDLNIEVKSLKLT